MRFSCHFSIDSTRSTDLMRGAVRSQTAALILLVGYWSTHGSDAQAALASLTKLEGAMGEGEKVFFGIGRARYVRCRLLLREIRADAPPLASKQGRRHRAQRAAG